MRSKHRFRSSSRPTDYFDMFGRAVHHVDVRCLRCGSSESGAWHDPDAGASKIRKSLRALDCDQVIASGILES